MTKAKSVSAPIGCLVLASVIGLLFCGVPALVGFCGDWKSEIQKEHRKAEEEARKIEIPKITTYVCEVDGEQETRPPKEERVRVLPESAEGQAGEARVVVREGYCEKHLAEKVRLVSTEREVCPGCPDEFIEKTISTKRVARAELPEGVETEDHKTYILAETQEVDSACASRVCLCMAGATPERECRGKWVKKVTINPMDDTKTVTLSVDANDKYQGWLGSHRPTLVLRCQSNKTEVALQNKSQASVEYGRFHQHTVTLRYDDAPSKKVITSESTTGEALFLPSAIPNIKKMLEADTLLYEFTPFNANPATVSFDLRGLEEEIGSLRGTCGW